MPDFSPGAVGAYISDFRRWTDDAVNATCGVNVGVDYRAVSLQRYQQRMLDWLTSSYPTRHHKRRRWDRSGNYHRRIQKKWNKRFGVYPLPRVVFDPR